jgi:hypothetical protein
LYVLSVFGNLFVNNENIIKTKNEKSFQKNKIK